MIHRAQALKKVGFGQPFLCPQADHCLPAARKKACHRAGFF
jgi:hypothetical protein